VLICELKPRLHNSIIISRRGLCLPKVTVPSNLLQRLSKDFIGCATVSLPSIIYFNFRSYFTKPYMRYNMYSGRPCENSLQRRRVEGRKYLDENITKVMVVVMVFKIILKYWFSVYMQISKPMKTKNTYSQILQPYRYTSLEKNTAVLPWSLRCHFQRLRWLPTLL
jgi:hypothetical protein